MAPKHPNQDSPPAAAPAPWRVSPARALRFRMLGLASGLLLMLGHLYAPAAPLQAVALLPLLFAAAAPDIPIRLALAAGAYAGLAHTLPQVVTLRMPPLIAGGLVAYLAGLMCAFGGVSWWLFRRKTLGAALGVGAAFALVDWVNFTAVPIWGTAQSLVRPWSAYPQTVRFVSVTGITGIALALATMQALVVFLARHPQRRRAAVWALFTLVAGFSALNVAARPSGKARTIAVAAVGWASPGPKDLDAKRIRLSRIRGPEDFAKLVAGPVAAAAEKGARLVVLPETAFIFRGTDDRRAWMGRLRRLAADCNALLVVGYADRIDNRNRLLLLSPAGKVLAQYTKTHLTPFESYRTGDGRVVAVDVDGLRVGGIICQDDNFTALSRAHGRHGTAVLAVPTNDWLAVKDVHFQNTIHRAIESRCAVVRAAREGISAIVAPDGRVLAQMDHFEQGPGGVYAHVPVHADAAPTLFSRLGHWPVPVAAAWLLAQVAWAFREARRKDA